MHSTERDFSGSMLSTSKPNGLYSFGPIIATGEKQETLNPIVLGRRRSYLIENRHSVKFAIPIDETIPI